jgi:hypothetical protein
LKLSSFFRYGFGGSRNVEAETPLVLLCPFRSVVLGMSGDVIGEALAIPFKREPYIDISTISACPIF